MYETRKKDKTSDFDCSIWRVAFYRFSFNVTVTSKSFRDSLQVAFI